MKRIPSTLSGRPASINNQRGVVLFFALIAMVVVMLAAVALTRTVDTTTVIAGNLAFKQSANASTDVGLARATAWLRAGQVQADNLKLDPFTRTDHPFNNNNPAAGYYTFIDPNLDLMAESSWTAANSADAGTDASGNQVRYIIQRMCRVQRPTLEVANCQFSDGDPRRDSMGDKNYTNLGWRSDGANPLVRITVRVRGARNTISYSQGFYR